MKFQVIISVLKIDLYITLLCLRVNIHKVKKSEIKDIITSDLYNSSLLDHTDKVKGK